MAANPGGAHHLALPETLWEDRRVGACRYTQEDDRLPIESFYSELLNMHMHRLSKLLIVLGLLFAGWKTVLSETRISEGAQRRYQEGLAHAGANRPQEALESFSSALKEYPLLSDAYAESGLIYMRSNQVSLGIQSLRAAAELNPIRPHIYCQLAEAYLADYDPKLARTHLEAALAFRPDCPHAHYIMGEWYRRKVEFNKAIAEFKLAAELAPDSEGPLIKIADICLSPLRQDLDEAEWALRRARSIAPKHPIIEYLWGRLWAQRPPTNQNLRIAHEALKMAASSQPGANSHLGLVCEKLNRPDEALRYYQKALAAFPNDRVLCYNTAQFLQRLGRNQEARELFERTEEIHRTEKEISRLEMNLEPDANNKAARLHLAELYQQLGALDTAEMHLRLAFSEAPGDAEIRKRLETLHERSNN